MASPRPSLDSHQSLFGLGTGERWGKTQAPAQRCSAPGREAAEQSPRCPLRGGVWAGGHPESPREPGSDGNDTQRPRVPPAPARGLSPLLRCSGLRGPFAIIARTSDVGVGAALGSVRSPFAFGSLSPHFALSALFNSVSRALKSITKL